MTNIKAIKRLFKDVTNVDITDESAEKFYEQYKQVTGKTDVEYKPEFVKGLKLVLSLFSKQDYQCYSNRI